MCRSLPAKPPHTRTEAPGPPLDLLDGRSSVLPARVLRPAARTISAAAAAGGPARRFPVRRSLLIAGKRLLAAQLDLAFTVDPDDLDENRVALVDHVLDT